MVCHPLTYITHSVRITKYLPSGKYQVAMVPYIKDDNDTMIPMAPPSCSTRLVRINLGQYALHITFCKFQECLNLVLKIVINIILYIYIIEDTFIE